MKRSLRNCCSSWRESMRNYLDSSSGASRRGGKVVPVLVIAVSVWMLMGNCSALKPNSPEDFSQGKDALRSGDYGKARKSFESALKDKANLEESQAGLLQTLRETGAYQEAVKRSEEFLASRTGSPLLHLERGRSAEAIGDYPGAEKHLRQARALAQGGSAIYLNATHDLAEVLDGIGRRADARILWDQLIEEYRKGRIRGSQSLGDVAIAALRRGYVQDAIDIFMDATDPKLGEVSLESLANFGYLFLEKYHATEALGVFRDCLKITRFYPEALIGIALAKRYESDFEAETYAEVALKVNPNFVPALNALAELAITADITAGAGTNVVADSPRMRRLQGDYDLMQELAARTDMISFVAQSPRPACPPNDIWSRSSARALPTWTGRESDLSRRTTRWRSICTTSILNAGPA